MSDNDSTLAEKMSDPNSVLYFFKVLSCLGNQGKNLKYSENEISSIEKDIMCYGEGVKSSSPKNDLVTIKVYVSFIGTMISCLKYEMTDENHNVVQSGINSESFTEIDLKNLRAGIDHFIKCSRKRKKKV